MPSTRASGTKEHRLRVDRMTEDQWITLHGLCGEHHPGRFKEWVNDSGTGFDFHPSEATYRGAVLWATAEGLAFSAIIASTVNYAPEET